MSPTYLYIEDLPDAPNPPRDLEGEQEERLQTALGLTLWAWLEDKLMEDENARTNV
jgi:hypothetical protein